MATFVDEKYIGVRFVDEKARVPVFVNQKSPIKKLRSDSDNKFGVINETVKYQFQEIQKVNIKLNKIAECLNSERFDKEKFINWMGDLPEDVKNQFKGDKGEDGKTIKELHKIETKIDEKEVEKIVSKFIKNAEFIKKPSDDSLVKMESITFDKFLDFFKQLPKEQLDKIRGPRGMDGLSGGFGPQGQKGEKGEKGDPGSGSAASVGLREFQTLSGVTGMSETQVFSYTNSTGASIFLNEIAGESQARSEWLIYINDVLKERARTSVSDHNLEQLFYNEEITNGSTVKVKVIHYEASTIEYSVAMKYHA